MEKELEEILVGKYPIIFKEYGGDIRKTCMGWGMSCGDGWFTLLDDLCGDIKDIIGRKDIKVVAEQVKEKFGGLRFYHGINYKPSIFSGFNNWLRSKICAMGYAKPYWKAVYYRKKVFRTTVEKIDDRIHEAEGLSYKTCENCGQPGERKPGGWIQTLCNNCWEDIANGGVD